MAILAPLLCLPCISAQNRGGMGKKQKGKHGNSTKETPQRVCDASWRGEILVRASSHLSNSHALDLLQDRLSMPDEPPPMYPLNLQGAVQSSHRLAPNTLFNRRATRTADLTGI